jgi:diguanylate cyclase (GGDEF)-like protein/PAS domain S-box-containing protein
MVNNERQYYKEILDSVYKGIYSIDLNKRITYWNEAAERITGYKPEDAIGRYCWDLDLNGTGICHTEMCLMQKAIDKMKIIEEQEYMKHKDGYRVPVLSNVWAFRGENGSVCGIVHMFTNRAAKISSFEKIEKLKKLAFIDELTGAGNRRYTEIKVLTKLNELEKFANFPNFGILFIDVDNFKEINDVYGHNTGDRILQMIVKTIMNNIREFDFLGRWGGEEFVALLSDISEVELLMVAEKIRELVQNSSLTIEGKKIEATVSIGATMARREDTITKLISRADKLMYFSKKIGKNLVSAG